jgi:hypothetical protein
MTVPCYYFKYQISNCYLPSVTTVFTSLFATNCKNKFTAHRLVTTVCTATLHSLGLEINSWCNMQNPIFKLHYLIFIELLSPLIKKGEGKNPNQGCTRNVAIHQWIRCIIQEVNQHPAMQRMHHLVVKGYRNATCCHHCVSTSPVRLSS